MSDAKERLASLRGFVRMCDPYGGYQEDVVAIEVYVKDLEAVVGAAQELLRTIEAADDVGSFGEPEDALRDAVNAVVKYHG